jgi:thiamine biosynthesis lipoprotein
VAELSFTVMGAPALLALPDENRDLLEVAHARLDELEQKWSRFLPDSEVSRLNHRPGVPAVVSDDTALLVVLARIAHEQTAAWFNPALLAELVDAGYDRSHELLPAPKSFHGLPSGGVIDPRPAPRLPDSALMVDRATGVVHLGSGMAFDPGGIGKGLAADLVAAELLQAGAEWAQVELGGDVRVAGPSPHGGSWPVLVDAPSGRLMPMAAISLPGDGGVATSSRAKRRWSHYGADQHHLIDPRTGRPSMSPLLCVTVVAGETWWAEVLAKAALLAGPVAGRSLIEAHEAAALFVDEDGGMSTVGPLDQWLTTFRAGDRQAPVEVG